MDASPWGGGAVLYVNDRPSEFYAVTWDQDDFADQDVQVGEPRSQTYFEVLAFVLAVDLWGIEERPTPVLGDNTAALGEALVLRGKGSHRPLAQALAVIRARQNIDIVVAHLPSEDNTAADALSRLSAPGDDSKPFPFEGWAPPPRQVRPSSPRWLWSLLTMASGPPRE